MINPGRRWHSRWSVWVTSWLFISLCSACGAAHTPTTFNNPLNPVDGADPWLQFYQGNYYLTATQWSSIRMWKAPTIAGLATAKPVMLWSDHDPTRCCNVWAPEFHLLDGPSGQHWYIYYTAGTDGTLDNQRTHVLESAGTDPLGPYTYKGRIYDAQHDTWAIDGSVLKMQDGKLYFLFSAFAGPDQSIYIAPMSNPWTISGARVVLSTPTNPWEQATGKVNEGPEALQHDGKTFIIYSASACWGPDYALGMLTYNGGDVLSTSSWVKSPQPVFVRADANGVYAPGHNGFFTSPDGKENWIVYHANSAATDGCTGTRTTRVQKFTWNADGTPNFGTPASLDTAITPPTGETGTAGEPAPELYYTLAAKAGNQCLQGSEQSGAAAPARLAACATGPTQQWSVGYLGNGYYRVSNRASGQALEVAGGPSATQDGGPLDQAGWTHSTNQQWRFMRASDGWLRLEARHSGKDIDGGTCSAGSALVQRAQAETDCQQFRLEPVGDLEIVNANSDKMLAVAQPDASGAAPVVLMNAAANNPRWNFVHQANGYYQVKVSTTNNCLDVAGQAGSPGARVVVQPCGSGASEQWRIEPLNDGMLRLAARSTDVTLDVVNCRMGDGTTLQEWTWLNNPCQRFRLVAP